MTTDARSSLPGLDLDRLGAWFATEVPGAGDRLSAQLVAGGKSNLTYVVSDGQQEWIVRRPPLGHVLATAHDMGREHRVMTALRDTPVPVPTTYAMCRDESVLGAPFYVMERCLGTPYRRSEELATLGPDRTRVISERLVDVLTALHEVEPESVGLGDFGRPEGFLARQVNRWKRQLDASYCRDLPAADELVARLSADVPPESATGIVHGDYRLDNAIIDPADGRVTAILDWELCTLGDPMADVGMLMVYWVEPEDSFSPLLQTPTVAPGFPGRKEIAAQYAARSGRDLSNLDYYVALGTWKVAVILEGVYNRYASGAYGETDGDWRHFDTVIPALAQAAHEAAGRARI